MSKCLDTLDRLLNAETDDCLIWPHSLGSAGYGQVGHSGTVRGVHVIACEHHHGPRPTGAQVAHSCGQRSCMNYRHLRWATPAENAADKVAQGTAQRGEQASNVKLTEAQVHEIRHLKAQGEKATVIAARYGVTVRTVTDIARGARWSWLPNIDADVHELPSFADRVDERAAS